MFLGRPSPARYADAVLTIADNQAIHADTAAHSLDGAVEAGVCGVIIDLRGNTGGDMGPMVAGLSGLLPDGAVLEFVSGNHISPVTVSGNLVQGGGSAVTVKNSRTFGSPTAGYASANIAFQMPDKAQVMITSSYDRDRTGATYGVDPIAPDQRAKDPVAAATSWLATDHHCHG